MTSTYTSVTSLKRPLTSDDLSSASLPSHLWDLCILCRQTNSLEFTAWSSVRSICWQTPNNLGGTWRRICSQDIWSVDALEVLRNPALRLDITYILSYYVVQVGRCLLTSHRLPPWRCWLSLSSTLLPRCQSPSATLSTTHFTQETPLWRKTKSPSTRSGRAILPTTLPRSLSPIVCSRHTVVASWCSGRASVSYTHLTLPTNREV